MKDLIKLLSEKSKGASFLTPSRLYFQLSTFAIIVDIESYNEEFSLFDEFYEKEFREGLPSIDDPYFDQIKISEISITGWEYLGDREGISEKLPPVSITSKLYLILSKINEIDPKSVSKFEIDTNSGYDDSGDMCPGEPNFIFNIYIQREYFLNEEFFKRILEIEIKDVTPPRFYWKYYFEYKKIGSPSELNILNTNTKARRIGYLKLLTKFIHAEKKISSSYINKKFEKYADKYSKDLLEYKNTKGLIKLNEEGIAGNSASPYVKLAQELKIISLLNNIYSEGKYFKVYSEIQNGSPEKNIFKLSLKDKFFFLESLLQKDYFYLFIILEFIMTQKDSSYTTILNSFQNSLLQKLSILKNDVQFENRKIINEIKETELRIKNWKNPNKYLEHIIMPRLNWLYDLDLINLDSDLNIKITENGTRLFNNFCSWCDINWSYVFYPEEFLNTYYVYLFDNTYNSNEALNQKKETEIIQEIENYLKQSFEVFKTLAPNRVTFSQATNFTIFKLFFDKEIKVSIRYVRRILEENKIPSLIFKFQNQYKDGYIQQKK